MRIIAGDYKGRRLTSPADNRVRPTTDKVKEAIEPMFNSLFSYDSGILLCLQSELPGFLFD